MASRLEQSWPWFLAAGLAGLFAVSLLLIRQDGNRINRANYEKIHSGMTRDEVDTLLGSPTFCYPKAFDSGYTALYAWFGDWLNDPAWEYENYFIEDGYIWVQFDRDGRVAATGFVPPRAGNLWAFLCDWAGKMRDRFGW